ncbi:hypothetical protein N665_0593s0046 [Sinapis alba]|nr:hypothetical protein N665_0593s0046 [Sinapis alba]
MENLDDEYKNYWETTMFFQNQELEFDSYKFSLPLEEAFSGSGESSSPDGAATSPVTSKNVASERKRREKLNQRLFALRSVVPNISKLDKASIIRDSIKYMQELIDQEKKLEAEIRELESRSILLLDNPTRRDYDPINNFPGNQQQDLSGINAMRSKKSKQMDYNTFGSSITRVHNHSLIEVLEMTVTCMGEKTVVVCITCSKKRETMLQLCKVLESLNLNILTTNFSSFSSRLSTTLFLQANEEEMSTVETKIQTAIAAYNDPNCFINF